MKGIPTFVLVLTGCAEAGILESLPEPEPAGTHLRFWTDRPEALCGGTLSYMDAYVGVLKQLHGTADDYVVDYYWKTEGELPCSARVACALGPTVHSRVIPLEHELVHAVRNDLGLAQIYFEEGAAELWGDDVDWPTEVVSSVVEGVDSVDGPYLDSRYYQTAGMFSRYLLEEFGPDFIVELARQTSRTDPYAAVDRVFMGELGASLAEVAARFEAERPPSCPKRSYRDVTPTCDVAPRVDCSMASGGNITVNMDLSCGSEQAIGPRNAEVWAQFVFDVPPAGSARVRYETAALKGRVTPGGDYDDFGGVTVQPCNAQFCMPERQRLQYDVPTPDALSPGAYLVTATRRTDAPQAIFEAVSVIVEDVCP